MRFLSVNASVTDLWNSLRSFVGDSAVSEITARPPAGEDDEASFLRLVVWSYAMAFEAGRVVVPQGHFLFPSAERFHDSGRYHIESDMENL